MPNRLFSGENSENDVSSFCTGEDNAAGEAEAEGDSADFLLGEGDVDEIGAGFFSAKMSPFSSALLARCGDLAVVDIAAPFDAETAEEPLSLATAARSTVRPHPLRVSVLRVCVCVCEQQREGSSSTLSVAGQRHANRVKIIGIKLPYNQQ
jgi:hypothetical protein